MTLILTVASSAFVLQVSDRLVTSTEWVVDPTTRTFVEVPRAFDAAANKTAIYHARNGILTIGYSGPAYIDGVPTDQWLASILHGEAFHESDPGTLWALAIGRAPQWLDVGQALSRLRGACDACLGGSLGKRAERLEIVVAGFQWKRRRCWPISYELRFSTAGQVFELFGAPRNWHFPRRRIDADEQAGWLEQMTWPLWLTATPNRAMKDERLIDLAQLLIRAGWRPAEWARIYSEVIREASGRSGYIGRDCMSVVVMPPSRDCRVEVEYVSETIARAVLVGPPTPIPIAVSFSPWILGPMIVRAPSISTGTSAVSSGPFTIEVKGPPPSAQPTGISFSGAQQRPAEPGRLVHRSTARRVNARRGTPLDPPPPSV